MMLMDNNEKILLRLLLRFLKNIFTRMLVMPFGLQDLEASISGYQNVHSLLVVIDKSYSTYQLFSAVPAVLCLI